MWKNFRRVRAVFGAAALAAVCAVASPVAHAATCGNTAAGFEGWLQDFKQEAIRSGVSPQVVDSALSDVTYNPTVVRYDRDQRSFNKSFDAFYLNRVNKSLTDTGRRYIANHKAMLNRIEQRWGVPPAVVVALWGLETHYGFDMGHLPVIRSLATLAYDCRRSDFFRAQLLAALKVLQRGWLSPGEMKGAWAGEVGQTQFLMTRYLDNGVDFDGNGRPDLIHSVPDALASTAAFLAAHGWRRGQPWDEGTPNYDVIHAWNGATVYDKTIAKFAKALTVEAVMR